MFTTALQGVLILLHRRITEFAVRIITQTETYMQSCSSFCDQVTPGKKTLMEDGPRTHSGQVQEDTVTKGLNYAGIGSHLQHEREAIN